MGATPDTTARISTVHDTFRISSDMGSGDTQEAKERNLCPSSRILICTQTKTPTYKGQRNHFGTN